MLLFITVILICQAGHIETRCANCPNDCDINGKCNTCPENCENCTHSSNSGLSCGTCKPGYYGPQCNHNCSQNCQDRDCKKDDGACSKGCVVGYYGLRCHQNCPLRCNDGKCNQYNGFCSKECVIGYYGRLCDLNCSLMCQDRECSKDNGTCYKGCEAGYYGHFCEHYCPVGFQDQECNISNAVCCKGCAVGFHGQLCNVSCSKGCRQSTCHRLNGTCIHGCIEGYYGETCHPCHNCTKGTLQNQHHLSSKAIMALVLTGIILVAAAVVPALIVRWRRRQRITPTRRLNLDHQHDKSTFQNPTFDDASGNDNTSHSLEAKPNVADQLYIVNQNEIKKRCNEMDQAVADSSVCNVTSTERQSEINQRCTKMEAEATRDDTYSHISHVDKMGRLVDGQHRNDGKNDDDDTYNHTYQQFARVTTDHAIYNTVGDVMMHRTLENI